MASPSILIARHGPVALDAPGFLLRDEFLRFVDAYERAGLRDDARPPDNLAQRVNGAAAIHASAAPRVADSLKALRLEREAIVDPLFGEEPLSVPRLAGRLPLFVWFSLSRGAGAFHPNEAGTRAVMRLRAERAAARLAASASSGPVALVGHGWFNRAIVRALAEKGWRPTEAQGGSAPWSHVVLQRRQKQAGRRVLDR